MNTNKILSLATAIVLGAFLIPANGQNKIAIAAHRGFWNCEEAGYAQNSTASLLLAQANEFWGSEVDVHLTKDDKILVNHDNTIGGFEIETTPMNVIRTSPNTRLKNGETPNTMEECLSQARKSDKTVLVLELKPEKYRSEAKLVNKSIKALKRFGLYDPERVIFISFSLDICKMLAAKCPEFTNQYLNGDLSPRELKAYGINGLDYNEGVFRKHPEWVREAHELGQSVNVWTVDKEENIRYFIDLGVDCITTNQPLLVRKLLGERELRK